MERKKKKKKSRSKQKGAAFEREVCGKLSIWVSGGERDDCFWRSAMSGGRATVRFKRGKATEAHTGDITATSSEGHAFLSKFIVECKHVRDLALVGAMLRGTGLLASFWTILEEEAVKHKRRPILIAKQNNFPTLAFLRAGDAQFFGPISSRKRACFCRLGEHMVEVYLFKHLIRPKNYREHLFTKVKE